MQKLWEKEPPVLRLTTTLKRRASTAAANWRTLLTKAPAPGGGMIATNLATTSDMSIKICADTVALADIFSSKLGIRRLPGSTT